MPLCTIITPIYNLISGGRTETFLQMLESVSKLDHNKIEHIIVDGASQDGTHDLIDRAQTKGYRFKFISEPDTGIYDAMNKGIAAAIGDYIYFLNSDDYLHDPESMMKVFDKLSGSRFDFAYGNIRIDKSGKIKVFSSSLHKLFYRMPFSHPSLIVKKTTFKKIGVFDTSFQIAGDYDFILRLLFSGALGHKYRNHFVTFREGGVSSGRDRNAREKKLVWNKHYNKTNMLNERDLNYILLRRHLPRRLAWAYFTDRTLPRKIRAFAFLNYLKSFKP